MRAYASLRRQGEFSRLYRRGKRVATPHLLVYHFRRRPGSALRLGIAVAKTVGRAVERNKIRRRLKCLLDGCDLSRARDVDLLIVAKPGAATLSYAALAAEARKALRESLCA